MKIGMWLLRLCGVLLLFSLVPPSRGSAESIDRYAFQEGEPLTYKTDVTVVIDTGRESKYFEHFGKSKGRTNVKFDLEYQLMPISHERWWKVRLVLDQVKRTINRDGEVDTAMLDREQLRNQHLSVGDMLNLNIWELGVPAENQTEHDEAQTTTATNCLSLPPKIERAEKVRVPEDLFDRPILTWFAPDGTLESFEDRSETEEIMDGLDLKECIKLLIPRLPVVEIKVGASWTQEELVDLPEPPLAGQKYEPLKWKLIYTVKTIDRGGDRLCARIAVRGRFARDGLWIPIGQETRKYLVWTTMITNLENQIDGEFVYDVEQKVMRASTVKNTYRYSTLEARKSDNYRGKIITENSLQTRITSALVESAQQLGGTGKNQALAIPEGDTSSNATQGIHQIFENQAFNQPQNKKEQKLETIYQ